MNILRCSTVASEEMSMRRRKAAHDTFPLLLFNLFYPSITKQTLNSCEKKSHRCTGELQTQDCANMSERKEAEADVPTLTRYIRIHVVIELKALVKRAFLL